MSPGPAGALGVPGPAGPGLVAGSVLTLPAVQTPPAGITLLGSSARVYFDSNNSVKYLQVKYYKEQ